MTILNFIYDHWEGILVTLISGSATAAMKKIQGDIKKDLEEKKIIKSGLVGLLHNSLFRSCEDYINRGEITTAELDNLACLYESYHNLGGNGTGTALYERCKQLKIKTQ